MEDSEKMKEKKIEFETLSLDFEIDKDNWQLNLAKSQTKVKDFRQIRLLTEVTDDSFVPIEVTDEGDTFAFHFTVDPTKKTWEDLKQLRRNDKLRLLCNVAQLKKYLHTRITFFLHPDNLIFDNNLMPSVIYRGVRDLLPPFEMDEKGFLKQLQCLSIALISPNYDYDQLYNGALKEAQATEFERQVISMQDLDSLIDYLHESYDDEQEKSEKEMQVYPVKRFRLFKQLSIIMIVLTVLLAAPLVYLGFFHLPYNQHLLDAHENYLASDYGGVITTLEDEKADKLPKASKYILANSYINTAHLSAEEKKSVMKNVSLKSDDNYLLYWIYDGRGEFGDALDTAKYLDDPQLIMYGLIQKIEATKNDPDLDGEERDEEIKSLKDELKDYREEYNLEEDEDEESESTEDDQDAEESDDNDSNDDKSDKDESDDDEKSSDDKDKKKKSEKD